MENGYYRIVKHEPLGVCCGVTAWNASLLFAIWKSAPALATGNVVILKPSEKSPIGTAALAALYREAGFPPGVFQVLLGAGDVGAILSSHMDIDKISFTGSTAVGRKIQEASAKSNLKRVTLELGGKSPAIVFRSANIDQALAWVTAGITINTGQVCAATSRLFVEAPIFDEFLARLKTSFEAITENLGMDPLNPKSQYGPLIDQAQYDKVWQSIEENRKTTKILTGGKDENKGGNYMAPTIFVEPDRNSKVYREEIFGPVLCVRSFTTEAEVIEDANDTEYGLSGQRFTTIPSWRENTDSMLM
jgi:aldehyde dehydrogenase (NAD+)